MPISNATYSRRLRRITDAHERRLLKAVAPILKRIAVNLSENIAADLIDERAALVRALYKHGLAVGSDSANLELSLLPKRKGPIQPESWRVRFRRWVEQRAFEASTLILTSSIEKARAVLANQIEGKQLSIKELARAIALSVASKGRALAIARTEIAIASNHAGDSLAKDTGLTYTKIWVSAADERTRPSHVAANGTKADRFGLFNVGGYDMEYPTDGSHGAPAGEIVNCRCASRRIYDL